MLLGRDDVDRDKPDKSGRTPLWWATENGTRKWWLCYSLQCLPLIAWPKLEEALSSLPAPEYCTGAPTIFARTATTS